MTIFLIYHDIGILLNCSRAKLVWAQLLLPWQRISKSQFFRKTVQVEKYDKTKVQTIYLIFMYLLSDNGKSRIVLFKASIIKNKWT